MYEDQIADYLATFTIPADYRDQIIALHAQSKSDQTDATARLRQIEARLTLIKDLYGWGDIERAAYQVERDTLNAELATIRDVGDQSSILGQTAVPLADMPTAWTKVTQEQRNKLARLMFERVVVENRTVAAVKPRPDFASFLALDYFERLKVLSGGSDGDRRRASITYSHECRVPVALRHHRSAGRYTVTHSKITPTTAAAIRADREEGRSLRDLAKTHGLSHETIRQVLRSAR